MNLTPNKIKTIVSRHEDLTSLISNRWSTLIGFGCGYLKDFTIEGDYIRINFTLRGNTGYDVIHQTFFLLPEDEAKKQFANAKKETLESFAHSWIPQRYTPNI